MPYYTHLVMTVLESSLALSPEADLCVCVCVCIYVYVCVYINLIIYKFINYVCIYINL